ncbi:MAG: DUF115 domain-containing protein [Spirochaetaceae bacterium]|jgi:hypothetical protein|nr:DUF115 domain-containing protein [Spirochaetaceae bacterium]
MSYFKKNLAILKERFPWDKWDEETAEKSSWTVHHDSVTWASSQGISICSRHNPQREAQRFIAHNPSPYKMVCFLGLGLGYTPEAYVEAYPDSMIIVVERSMGNFRKALESRDLGKFLSHEKLYLLIDSQPYLLKQLLQDLQQPLLHNISHRVLYKQDEEYYGAFVEVINHWQQRKEVNRNTLKRFGKLWIRNFALNLPSINRANGLSCWRNRYKGVPAVVVAAGPGLDEQWKNLRELSSKMIIIGVDTAYRSLKRENIPVDFLVVTDPQYWNSRHLDFQEPNEILISDSSTHPRVFRQQKGPIFLSTSHFPLAGRFEDFLDVKLKSGGSVATSAWGMARLLGCSPIFLIGLDLSYPQSTTHNRGSYFEERSLNISRRLSGVAQHNWDGLHSAPAVYREGQKAGKSVHSDQRMSIYLDWFSEETAKAEDGPFINCSTRGAKIKGMIDGSLTMISHYPDIEEKPKKLLDRISKDIPRRDPERVVQQLNQLILSLDRCSDIVKAGMKGSEKLQSLFYENKDLQEQLEQLGNIDVALKNLKDRDIAGFLIEPYLEEILSKQDEKKPEQILQSSIQLYQEMYRSLEYHRKILKSSLEFFNK